MRWKSPSVLAFVGVQAPNHINNNDVRTQQQKQCTIDVAVIGSGFSGLAAAIEAANSGATSVCIFEKMPTPGGNSVLNAGQIAAVGSSKQADTGIHDSIDLMKADMLRAGRNLNHPALLEKLIEKSSETIDWTIKELDVKYRDRLTQMGGHSVPRTLSTEHATGRDIIDPMLKIVKEHPSIDLQLNTKLNSIVMEGNHVKGILVSHCSHGEDNEENNIDDALELINCRKGVILAAGGFSADVAFRSLQNPALHSGFMTTNHPGATAEVLKEALKIGAVPVQLSQIQLGPGTSPDETRGVGISPLFCNGACFPYGIMVDPKTSKRFVNEMANRWDRSTAIIGCGHPVICLTDSNGVKHSLEKDLQKLKPTVREFASLEDVAAAYGMDISVLQNTVDDYNLGVLERRDLLGKSLRNDVAPISTPPFYSIRLWPKVHHTMGGLLINDEAQVMHVNGHSIDGLYAAGEITGGVHGADRLASCAALDCLTFGRLAGRHVMISDKQPMDVVREDSLSMCT